jgi:hypothetical protein
VPLAPSPHTPLPQCAHHACIAARRHRPAKTDAFVHSLLDILLKVSAEGEAQVGHRGFRGLARRRQIPAQPFRLGIHRSDYMLHTPTTDVASPDKKRRGADGQKFLQGALPGSRGAGRSCSFGKCPVEINTISSAFGGLSYLVSKLHRCASHRAHAVHPHVRTRPPAHSFVWERHLNLDGKDLPVNNSLPQIAAALAQGCRLHKDPKWGPRRRDVEAARSCDACSAVVLMIVQAGERNSTDQRLLEYALWDRCGR